MYVGGVGAEDAGQIRQQGFAHIDGFPIISQGGACIGKTAAKLCKKLRKASASLSFIRVHGSLIAGRIDNGSFELDRTFHVSRNAKVSSLGRR